MRSLQVMYGAAAIGLAAIGIAMFKDLILDTMDRMTEWLESFGRRDGRH